ncbi:MAG TPA: stage II sporulation protein M [Roseiflexaceae bacterium]|nr:stage II sporulation protein M [Roseiflexaceae bacterium]
MSLAAVRTITRREVSETLTDWRILLPIFILVVVLPQLLIAAADVTIEFVGDAGTVTRLIPFAMLLVGFIPASFSLITALESFVGERERNSLESLLSMPISDNALYLGKFFSALLPPLLSSCLAMCLFGLTLRLREPELFARGLTLEYFTVVLLLIVAKSFVMVAGAVIISSHTSSIRAANLLASFVLLPTASAIQLEAILMIGQRWDVLWLSVLLLAVMALALVRTGMGAFNREEILSREHEQLNLRRLAETFMAFLREYHPAGVTPDQYADAPFSARRFYTRELPAMLRDYTLPLGVALLAALAGALFGPAFHNIFDRLGQSPDRVGVIPAPDLALGVFTGVANAGRVLVSALLATVSFGLFAILVPFFAFGGVSYVATALAAAGGSWTALGPDSPLQFLLSYVLPHGVAELPAAILGAAMGVRVGAAIMCPPRGFSVGQNMLWSLAQFLKVWLLVIAPLFLLAGVLQQLVSTQVIRALYGG